MSNTTTETKGLLFCGKGDHLHHYLFPHLVKPHVVIKTEVGLKTDVNSQSNNKLVSKTSRVLSQAKQRYLVNYHVRHDKKTKVFI